MVKETVIGYMAYPNKITKKKKIVAISGYFDPMHIGHLELIKLARDLGDHLIVILNTDHQARLKKGRSFMPEAERKAIVESIQYVDEVVYSIDDDKTQRKTLAMLKPHIFANGGDRHNDEIPESPICRELGIQIIDGLGAKIQASSELIKAQEEFDKQNKELNQ